VGVTHNEADITHALDALKYARADGDGLKIALAENALNDLIDHYTCHSCQGSQPERKPRGTKTGVDSKP
jgi:hypothetical protein